MEKDMESKVLSRQQMKALQELGVDTSDAALSWVRFIRKSGKKKSSKWKVRMTKAERLNSKPYLDCGHYEGVPTYTLQEVLAKLPDEIQVGEENYELTDRIYDGIGYAIVDTARAWNDDPVGIVKYHVCFDSDNRLDNAFALLCWVLNETL